MRSFVELAEKEKENIISPVADGGSVRGNLRLDGADSSVRFQSKDHVRSENVDSGWFDLEVKDQDGRKILLHNMILRTSGGMNQRSDEWYFEAFPNLVVFDADKLGENNSVQRVAFRIDSLSSFFWYQLIESHSAYLASEEAQKSLDMFREAASRREHYPRDPDSYDFSDVSHVFFVHKSQEISFEADGLNYSIWLGMGERLGPPFKIDVNHEPSITITFPKAVAINEALDAVWRCRRFFNQLAFKELEVSAVSVSGDVDPKSGFAEIYLPNIEIAEDDARSDRKPHPGDLPFNRWQDKDRFVELFRTWLLADAGRGRFRIFVDQVLSRFAQSYSPIDVGQLCAAIDSLDLGERDKSIAGAIESMAAAAVKAAEKLGVEINENRICGALGVLTKPTMKDRIGSMFDNDLVEASSDKKRKFLNLVQRYRGVAAHGGKSAKLTDRSLLPTLQALLGLCVLYDLGKSGLRREDLNEPERRLVADREFSYAMMYLEPPT